MLIKRDSTLAT